MSSWRPLAHELLALFRPYPLDAMRAYRVSTAVNGVKNDGPDCVAPVG